MKNPYRTEVTGLILDGASTLELVMCIKKNFVNNPYFIEILKRVESDNNLMLSPQGNPNESEIVEAREIEKILAEIKQRLI